MVLKELDNHSMSTDSKAVIGKVKLHTTKYDIQDCIMSDNGPQYSSQEFSNIYKQFNIVH